MQDWAELVEGHLSELALEALADDRADLLAPELRAHLAACDACRARAEDARLALSELSATLSAELRVPLDDAALDALVRGALDALPAEHLASAASLAPASLAPASLAPASLAPVSLAPMPRPSRRALLVAAALGALTSLLLGVLSLDGLPSLGEVLSSAHEARVLSQAMNQLVGALVPGGWGTLALVLSALLAALLVPLRALVLPQRSPRGALARAAALTLGVLLCAGAGELCVPHARALDFTGEWPEHERLTVVAEGVPASVALERAAQAAGLGFVGALASDPPTHLRVRDASLRDVLKAVLGSDAPLVAERTATLLIVRARPAAPVAVVASAPPTVTASAPPPVTSAPPTATASTPPPAPATAPAATPASAAARRDARDRVSFGGNVTVRSGEVVESVVTMGGDATIEGEVLRDVVTMGGDVRVRRGAVVHGEIVAMGGEVKVDEGAQASARVELGATSHGLTVRGRDAHDDEDAEARVDDASATAANAAASAAGELAEWLRETLASASRHALLFLFGLLLLGLAPARLDEVTRTVAALPTRAGATGALSAVAALVLGVVLTITLVGIPGAILLALVTAVGVYAGLVAVAAVLGRLLPVPALAARPVLQLAAGVLALFLVSRVPIVGGLAPLVAALVGLGAVVITRGGTRAP